MTRGSAAATYLPRDRRVAVLPQATYLLDLPHGPPLSSRLPTYLGTYEADRPQCERAAARGDRRGVHSLSQFIASASLGRSKDESATEQRTSNKLAARSSVEDARASCWCWGTGPTWQVLLRVRWQELPRGSWHAPLHFSVLKIAACARVYCRDAPGAACGDSRRAVCLGAGCHSCLTCQTHPRPGQP